MKAFLKENIVIVAGITLPLLLTAIFFVSTTITKISTEDPEYSFLYTKTDGYSYNSPYRVIVKNNKAYLSYIPPKKNQHAHNDKNLQLYLHTPETGETKSIPLPEIKEMDKREELEVKDIADLNLSSNNTSPDGYIFGRNYRNSGNLMTEIFSSGTRSRNKQHHLSKNTKTYRIPNTDSYYINFVGWIMDEE